MINQPSRGYLFGHAGNRSQSVPEAKPVGDALQSALANLGAGIKERRDADDGGSPGAKRVGNFQAAKEGWLKTVARYPNLSGADLAVVIAISTHLNSKTRDAWPSIETLAVETNRNRSTVWRSVERLAELKLLEVRKGRGRRSSNHYCPLMGEIDFDPKRLRRGNK